MDKTMQQATIYVGLNDRITGVQKYDTEKYLSILKSTCRSYRVAFSVQILNGGYEYSKNICYKPCQAGRDISLAGLFYFAFTLR